MKQNVLFLNELTSQEKQEVSGGVNPVTEYVMEFLGYIFMTPAIVADNVGPYAGPVLDK